MLNIASRTLEAVGRVRAPRGAIEPPASIQPAGQSHEGPLLPRRTNRVKWGFGPLPDVRTNQRESIDATCLMGNLDLGPS